MKVYSVNLEHRKDRKLHLLHQFGNHKEFDLQIIPAIQNKFGALGLWRSLIFLINNTIDPDGEYFIFCEDDHQFTEDYDHDRLLKGIENARRFDADVLLGGISWFDIAVKCRPDLYWVNSFTGAQFMILFKPMYSRILEVANFSKTDALDRKISTLTSNIFVLYPFISIQKEFGYSDVTDANNLSGRVDHLFERASKRLNIIEKADDFIQAIKNQE